MASNNLFSSNFLDAINFRELVKLGQKIKYPFAATWSENIYSIDEGANEMYSDGNIISTNLDRWLKYNYGGLVENSLMFGEGSQHKLMYGLKYWMLLIKNSQASEIKINGELGYADEGEEGQVRAFNFLRNGFKIYIKQVYGRGDNKPSINHIFITENSDKIQDWSNNPENEYHKIAGFQPGEDVIYTVITGKDGYEYSESQFESLVDTILTQSGTDASDEVIKFDSNFIENLSQQQAIDTIDQDISQGVVLDWRENYEIENGGDNMYDNGNIVRTDLNDENLHYFYGKLIANSDHFGESSSYKVFNGEKFWSLVVENSQATEVYVEGDLGKGYEDGDVGEVRGFKFDSQGFEVFIKQVYNATHEGVIVPSVNHLFIVEKTGQHEQEFSDDAHSDFHKIKGFQPGENFVYTVIAGNNGYEYSASDFQGFADAIINQIKNENSNENIIFSQNFIANISAEDSINSIDSSISNGYSAVWDEKNNQIYVRDGGEDMYDDGNMISTNLSRMLPYSQGEIIDNSKHFGIGSRYKTISDQNIWMLAVQNSQASHVEINGDLGADGRGVVRGFDFVIGEHKIFIKQVFGTDDPSVNHIFIVKNTGNHSQDFSTNTDNDFHKITGFETGEDFIYMVVAGESKDIDGYEYQLDEFKEIVKDTISIFNGNDNSYWESLPKFSDRPKNIHEDLIDNQPPELIIDESPESIAVPIEDSRNRCDNISVHRFFNQSSKIHFYTTSTDEVINILRTPEWGYKYEGIAYQASKSNGTSLYRFYNQTTKSHFMTANTEEADMITGKPEWGFRYEGRSYNVSKYETEETPNPIHRFYHPQNDTHFYTASITEADNIITKSIGKGYSVEDAHGNDDFLKESWGYRYEGIAWYVPSDC